MRDCGTLCNAKMASPICRMKKHFTASSRVWSKQTVQVWGCTTTLPLRFYDKPMVPAATRNCGSQHICTEVFILSCREGLPLEIEATIVLYHSNPKNNDLLLTIECSQLSFVLPLFLFLNIRMTLQNELLCALFVFSNRKMRRITQKKIWEVDTRQSRL